MLLSTGNRKGKGKSINLSLCFVSNALKWKENNRDDNGERFINLSKIIDETILLEPNIYFLKIFWKYSFIKKKKIPSFFFEAAFKIFEIPRIIRLWSKIEKFYVSLWRFRDKLGKLTYNIYPTKEEMTKLFSVLGYFEMLHKMF